MTRPWFRLSIFGLALLFLPVGCSRPAPVKSGRITVVASIFPLADIAKQIGGDRVDVITLLPPGQSPHEFEPKPREAESIARADLLITVGFGLDSWTDRAAQAAGAHPSQRIILSELVASSTDGTDPHVWLDPKFMETYASALRNALSAIDPPHAAEYGERTSLCILRLYSLDDDYRTALADCPNKSFVCFHAAYGRLAARYGLTQVSLMDISAAGFGPRRIESVITFIRDHHIKTIFAEPDEPSTQLQAIAAQTGATIAYLDDIGSPRIPGYDSYFALMRSNLAALVKALKE